MSTTHRTALARLGLQIVQPPLDAWESTAP